MWQENLLEMSWTRLRTTAVEMSGPLFIYFIAFHGCQLQNKNHTPSYKKSIQRIKFSLTISQTHFVRNTQ